MNNLTLLVPAKEEAESLPDVLKELKDFDYRINVILNKNDKSRIMLKENYLAKSYDSLGLYQEAYNSFKISNHILSSSITLLKVCIIHAPFM